MGNIFLLNKIKIKIKSLIKDILYNRGYILVDKNGFFYNQSISLIFAKHKYFNKKLNKMEKLFLTYLINNYPNGYSQRSQDLFALWVNSFVNFKNNHKFCIEFGAADGDFISNTKYLSELNYRSLLIEPSKKNFKKLIKNRPNDICLNYVVKSKNENEKQINFYDAGLYSSTKKNEDSEFVHNYTNSYKIKQKSLNLILSEYVPTITNFSYISVDVEGNELGILESIDFEKYRFNCMTIECPFESPNREKIIHLLNKYHYQVVFEKDVGITGVDLWFIHKDIHKKIK